MDPLGLKGQLVPKERLGLKDLQDQPELLVRQGQQAQQVAQRMSQRLCMRQHLSRPRWMQTN